MCMIDFDGDGYGELNVPVGSAADAGTDCDDTDAAAYPSATEIADSVDNDCDGTVDNISSSGTDADGDGFDLLDLDGRTADTCGRAGSLCEYMGHER